MARILSVNVAREGTVPMRGQQVRTGIFKEPVTGPVRVERLGLAGDFQVDKRFHGGPDKAVYLYPVEHYAAWSAELGIDQLPPGAFGENLTIEGILEHDVHAGDQLRAGSVLLEVTKPRMPCVRLAAKFGRADMVKRMHVNERSGFYARVIEEGSLAAGDAIDLVDVRPNRQTLQEIFRLKREQ